jgi:hypothetical protein
MRISAERKHPIEQRRAGPIRNNTRTPRPIIKYQESVPPPDLAVTVTATKVAESTAVALFEPPGPLQVNP